MRTTLQATFRNYAVVISVIVAIIVLSTRNTATSDLFHPALWAEDGTVFIKDASDLGAWSIVTTYAGYLHTIPRLVAYLADFLPLEWTPTLFHAAWIGAFAICVAVISSRLLANGMKPALVAVVAALFAGQPQAGEVFFTLTNLQWVTGVCLAVILIFPNETPTKFWHLALIILAGLTGPFSALLLPSLALRAWLFKDLRQYLPFYLCLAFCGLMQGLLLAFASSGGGHSLLEASGSSVLQAILTFLAFGNENNIVRIASFFFWIGVPWVAISIATWERFLNVKISEKTANNRNERYIVAYLAITTSLLFMIAAFMRDDLSIISPVIRADGSSAGSRYYLIPYSLILVSVVLTTFDQKIRLGIILVSFTLICLMSFRNPERTRSQWDDYANLSDNVSGLIIPIAPRIDAYPGWAVDTTNRVKSIDSAVQWKVVPLDSLSQENGHLKTDQTKHSTIVSSSANFQISIPLTNYCSTRNDSVAIEVKGKRAFDGIIHLLWGRDDVFSDKESIATYYPAGEYSAYFAFTHGPSDNTIRIRPGFSDGDSDIQSVRLICLDQVSR